MVRMVYIHQSLSDSSENLHLSLYTSMLLAFICNLNERCVDGG